MSNESMPPALTQSVSRALAILSCFSDREPELRVIDFAKKLELTQSNVSRLLTTMVSLGYVEKDEFSGSYRLGKQIASLAGIFLNHSEIRKQALPELHELEARLGLGANLGILDGDSMFYMAHVDSRTSPRMYTLIGHRNPLYCTAIGKVLLAFAERSHTEKLLEQMKMLPHTANTITRPEALRTQLETARLRGYAIELEELALGRACLAAPVRGRGGNVVAAVSVSGPLSVIELERKETELAKVLIEATDRISMKLGFVTVFRG